MGDDALRRADTRHPTGFKLGLQPVIDLSMLFWQLFRNFLARSSRGTEWETQLADTGYIPARITKQLKKEEQVKLAELIVESRLNIWTQYWKHYKTIKDNENSSSTNNTQHPNTLGDPPPDASSSLELATTEENLDGPVEVVGNLDMEEQQQKRARQTTITKYFHKH